MVIREYSLGPVAILLLTSLAFVVGCGHKPPPLQPPIAIATALMLNGQEQSALRVCNHELAERPDDLPMMILRAEVLERLGRADDAMTAYQLAVRLYPNDVDAKARLNHFTVQSMEVEAGPERVLLPQATESVHSSIDAPLAVGIQAKARDRAAVSDESSDGPSIVTAVSGVEDKPENDFGDKAYRQTQRRAQAAPKPASRRPTVVSPEVARLQKLAAMVAERSMPWHEDTRAVPELGRASSPESPDGTDLQPQVVRFDFGLGMAEPMIDVLAIPTTGRRSLFVELPTVERQRRFIGQSIARDQGCARGGLLFFPANRADGPDEDSFQPTTSCRDGKDNDGNGVWDKQDPACWGDPRNPDSYHPDLVEGRDLLSPSISIARPPRVNPVALRASSVPGSIPVPPAAVAPLRVVQ